MRQKPTVLAREIVASSRLFRVEQVQLRFSNGVERTYERLVGRGAGYGAVMIVAMVDAEHALLVEEYCGGTEDYQVSLPKGLVVTRMIGEYTGLPLDEPRLYSAAFSFLAPFLTFFLLRQRWQSGPDYAS